MSSPPYKDWKLPSHIWHSWSPERRERHLKEFRNYVPSLDDSFSKPQNVGRKPGYHRRQRIQGPPSMVLDRLQTFCQESIDQGQTESVTLVSSQSTSHFNVENPSHVTVEIPSFTAAENETEISFIVPRTVNEKEMELHLRATLSKSIKWWSREMW